MKTPREAAAYLAQLRTPSAASEAQICDAVRHVVDDQLAFVEETLSPERLEATISSGGAGMSFHVNVQRVQNWLASHGVLCVSDGMSLRIGNAMVAEGHAAGWNTAVFYYVGPGQGSCYRDGGSDHPAYVLFTAPDG